VSPRSDELLKAARRRVAAASAIVEQDPSAALSAAYYSMLYAARAALSERNVTARTHRGVWHELRRVFVDTGELDVELAAEVQKVQPEREQADYDAWFAPTADAAPCRRPGAPVPSGHRRARSIATRATPTESGSRPPTGLTRVHLSPDISVRLRKWATRWTGSL
jgi:uncharacterized protein (UPF0332 family)